MKTFSRSLSAYVEPLVHACGCIALSHTDDDAPDEQQSAIGEMAGSSSWKSKTFGSATQPSEPYFGRKKASRCFHMHCSVPNDQRKRCFARPRSVSGASVYADGAVGVRDRVARAAHGQREVLVLGERVLAEAADLAARPSVATRRRRPARR